MPTVFLILLSTAIITAVFISLLLFHYCYYHKIVATDKLCRASLLPGAAELTTPMLRLISILWLPLCRINKFGFYFPRRLLRSPILVGHQDYFLAPLPGSIALFISSSGSDTLCCNPFIMGRAHEEKIRVLPSTTRKGTTLSTSAALDSPSVINQLVTPPHAPVSRVGTTESETASENFDDISTVLSETGSLGPFLDATLARSRRFENSEIPIENIITPVASPESGESISDDLEEDYIEVDEAFAEKCRNLDSSADSATIMEFLKKHSVSYKLSADPEFATSPIRITDKDYEFSMDLSFISVVEKDPFCGIDDESAMEHMNKLSTLSSLFSDDTKLRTYFVTKIFPFSLKGDAKVWFGSLSPGCIKKPMDLVDVFFRKYYPASVQHGTLQRDFNYKQLQEENISETWSRFCYLLILAQTS